MPTSNDTLFPQKFKASHVAHSLKSIDHQKIAILAIKGNFAF